VVHLQPQPQPQLQISQVSQVYEELPVAPEELGGEEEAFDLYTWMEGNVQAIKADRAVAENATKSVQEGIESLTTITRGMQQATMAMAKAFQGKDDERIAKIVALVLAQQATAQSENTGATPSSVTLDDIEKKVTSPIKLMLYACAGAAAGTFIITYLLR
jgi:hypothetical protein